MPHRFPIFVLTLAAVACADQNRAARDSTQRVLLGETALALQQGASANAPPASPPADSQAGPAPTSPTRHVPRPRLSPEAQSIADVLVFVPRTRSWFTLSVRSARLVMDLGRADVAVPRDTSLRAGFRMAFQEAASALSPVPIGTVLRIRGLWGEEKATLTGFDVSGGRIVGRLDLPPRLASLARRNSILPGAATVAVDSAASADSAVADSVVAARRRAIDSCQRDSIGAALGARVTFVRDSLERWLADSARAQFPRLERRAKVKSWLATGCFRAGRVMLFAARHDPSAEFAVERAVVVDDSGRVVRLRVADLRFRVHEPLSVFDADGDGVDDIAARALGERSGGITILRFNSATKRLERLTSGFSWETR